VIARSIRLKPTVKQERQFNELFFRCTGVWNWSVKKISNDARDGVFHSEFDLNRLLKGHGSRCGINQQTLQQLASDAIRSWRLCWSGARGRPKLKGKRNRLSSVPLLQGIRFGEKRRIKLPTLGTVRYRHRGTIPAGAIKQARLVRKPRGWYVVLFIDAEPRPIPLCGDDSVGIDLGHTRLATLSTGEAIAHPLEYQRLERRLGQVQRGGNPRKAGRVQQSIANARRIRNHLVSRDLVARFGAIYVSKDNLRGMQRTRGKSVMSAGHGQLRIMLATKCRQAGRTYGEPAGSNSTRTCSSCGGLEGPAGLSGLKVRHWTCGACGAHHDRDQNAAVNALQAGAVLALRDCPRG
jgi:transposase